MIGSVVCLATRAPFAVGLEPAVVAVCSATVLLAGLLRGAQTDGLLDWLAPAVGTGTEALDVMHLSAASAVGANLVNQLLVIH